MKLFPFLLLAAVYVATLFCLLVLYGLYAALEFVLQDVVAFFQALWQRILAF